MQKLARFHLSWFFALVLLLTAWPAFAGGRDCRMLYYKNPFIESTLEFERLSNFGLNITQCLDAADLTLEYLMQFDVLILFGVGGSHLDGQASALETFVAVGGTLFIHQPNRVGALTYAPPGFEVTVLSSWWCNGPDEPPANICIVDPSHPLVSGFSGSEIGFAMDTIGEVGSGYSIVAVSCVCEDPALAAGQYGDGLVVLDTNNFWDPIVPADDYLLNFMEYLCAGTGSVATELKSFDGVKALYR